MLEELLFFPRCGGNCSRPYEPDVAHQPSLSYLPYLVTGDHFHLEELQFWANWDIFYGNPYNHDYSKGLISWEEVRGQAWGIRTLGHAAYITPDDHPLKSYFLEKLENNIQYYNEKWLDWNPLGYITNQEWLDLDNRIATWMDDFLTWTFGHLSELGFSKAHAFAAYKAKFPVGRMSHPDMCWILASTYWCAIMTPYPFTAESRPCTTWAEYKETIIKDWKSAFKIDSNPDISGQEQDLINAACNSTQMASILRLPIGAMIGYAYDPEGYPSNLQPALAVAVELGVENALQAWNIFDNRTVKPEEYDGGYNANPQWAIIPGIKIPVVNTINTENIYSQKENVIQIFPNPFNASAKVSIELIKTSHVQVTVYNILGQKVETLIDKTFLAGNNYIYWKPENLSGGLYLLNFAIGDINRSIKVLYLK